MTKLNELSECLLHPAYMDWFSKPLCRRYVLVQMKILGLPVREHDAVKDFRWCWALGLIKQGEYEVLGAWPVQAAAAYVAKNLHERGIEHIKVICAEGGADFTSEYPGASLWQSAEVNLDALHPGASRVLGLRCRAALRSAAATAQRLQTNIARAIKRRAPFADAGAAALFLAQSLENADRRFYLPTRTRQSLPFKEVTRV